MDTLRFLHIPKTAGSTFAGILISQYGLRNHFQFIGPIDEVTGRWNSLSNAKQQKTNLFLCHSPLVTGIDKADHAKIITFLRNPVNRVKSFCQHVFEGKSPYLKSKFPPSSFSLDDFLSSGELELNNLQTNILAGNAGGGPRRFPSGQNSEELLNRAWDILTRQIHCFGLLEEFDTSILLLKEKLGWKKDPFYVQVNKKSPSHQLEFRQHHLDKITELNMLDIELYKKADDYFMAQIDKNISAKELTRFQKNNSAKQPVTTFKWMFIRLFLKLERLSLGST